MGDDIPMNDKELERKAVTDPDAREKLRIAVRATVLNQVSRISVLRKIDKNREGELVDAGMSAFDHAFNVYMKNGMTFDETMNFSPYFAWWARQAIVAYLERQP